MSSERKWTADQQNAINASGGSLFVSAAAGSGKTAVLTERVVRLLTDEANPCDADELLIVTFTRAAAAEMREKIASALRREIARTGNVRLRRQLLLLPCADICTMDSFCSKLVKENFHLAGVSPDFRMLSEQEEAIYQNNACTAVLEELYETQPDTLEELNGLFSGERDDGALSDVIIKLYKYSQSYPFPEKWLAGVGEMYNPEAPISETAWGKIILEYIADSLDYAVSMSEAALDAASKDEKIYENYAPAISSDLSQLYKIRELAKQGKWDETVSAVKSFGILRLGSGTRGVDESLRDRAKNLRSEAVNIIRDFWDMDIPVQKIHEEDMRALAAPVGLLVTAVIKFAEKLSTLKTEENSFGFGDILHKAIELLVESTDGSRTQLSKSLESKYREILIDEYQDTNEAQDMLFYAVSKEGNNLFFVGDVKQSIYRFRLAMPEIFIRKKESLPLYDGKLFPSQIILDRNFRSRKSVCGCVNHVFGRIMSKKSGELEYGSGERLVPAAEYPVSENDEAELHIINVPDKTKQSECKSFEAEYAAEYIEKTVKSGAEVTDRGVTRPVNYGDFCILLRDVKNRGITYYTALKNRNIPASSPTDTPFFSTAEVSFMMSLLSAIDNPLLDVPLAAVLMFPVFGFTAQELARMRILKREEPLFVGLTALAESNDAKATDFLRVFAKFRDEASRSGVVELLFYLFEETGVFSVVSAMQHGDERRRNLLAFLGMAEDYTRGREGSLGGFVRFLSRTSASGKNVDVSGAASSENEVRIMTIHKSKGLEFPIVIIAGCSNKFNTMFQRENLLIDRKTGIGMVRRDIPTLSKYKTAPFTAARLSIELSERSEDLRLLYVAMTRARERLVMLCTKEESKDFSFIDSMLDESGRVYTHSIRKADSFYEWLVCSLVNHPDAKVLRCTEMSRLIPLSESDFNLKIITGKAEIGESTESEYIFSCEPDEEICEEIKKRIKYVYPYGALSTVSSKKTASSFAHDASAEKYFAKNKPAFAVTGADAASRGTAVHRFLEVCDFKAAALSAKDEADRLLEQGSLSQEQYALLDYTGISAFLSSSLGKRLTASDRVLREYKFSVFRSAAELYENIDDTLRDEQVVVEGILDCAFYEGDELVLIDYKTDRADNTEELKERYKKQLSMYKSALSECENAVVKETYIYSLYLSESASLI